MIRLTPFTGHTVKELIEWIETSDNPEFQDTIATILNDVLDLDEEITIYTEFYIPEYYFEVDKLTGDITLSEDLIEYPITYELTNLEHGSDGATGTKLGILIRQAVATSSILLRKKIAKFITKITGDTFLPEDVDDIVNPLYINNIPKKNTSDRISENKISMINDIVGVIKNNQSAPPFLSLENVEIIVSRFESLLNDFTTEIDEYDQDEINKILNKGQKPEHTLEQIKNLINNEDPYNNA